MRRFLPLLLLALLCIGSAHPAVATAAQESFVSIDARPAYEGAFRPATWMPFVVELTNSGPDRQVEVRIGTRQGAQYATRVDLPNSGRKSLTLYAYLTPASRRMVARLLSNGEELARQELTLQPANANARVVGVVAPDSVALRTPARLAPTTPLIAVALAPTSLPEQALGLSGLHALVLEDVRTDELSERQRVALQHWVIRGGQLIIGGGAELARTLDSLPPELRPASAGTVSPLPAESLFGPAAAGFAQVPYTALAPNTPAGNQPPYPVRFGALAGQEQAALELTLGRGAVTVLAFPLAHPALAGWEGTPALWGELLRSHNELPAGFAPENITFDGYVEGNLAGSLTSMPALEFPPLGLIIGLVLTYILLVGPGSYLVLKRLDRQSAGWVVVPAITLLFAGLTYGLGYMQRGGDVVMNTIALIEPVEGAAELARTRSFVGIFSPERRSYSLTATSKGDTAPLLRPISIQGPWDTSANAAGGVYLQDVNPGADTFELAQWSMRALSADSIVPFGPIEARVRLEGSTLTAEVRNGSAITLDDVAVVQGDRVVRLGTVAPGATASGELKRRQAPPGAFGPTTPVSYLVYGEEIDTQSRSGGQPMSLVVQQRVRLLDALYSYGPSLRGGQPLLVAWAADSDLELVPADLRADTQRSALVSLAPRVELGAGEATLGVGWVVPRFEVGQVNACFGGQGTGVTLGQEAVAFQLALPRDLAEFQASELTLVTASDGPWLDSITLELFDWRVGAWEPISLTGQQTEVGEPARFVGGGGGLRVRLANRDGQNSFGCVYVDARLKGSMP
jgi:hypothetical protein